MLIGEFDIETGIVVKFVGDEFQLKFVYVSKRYAVLLLTDLCDEKYLNEIDV